MDGRRGGDIGLKGRRGWDCDGWLCGERSWWHVRKVPLGVKIGTYLR